MSKNFSVKANAFECVMNGVANYFDIVAACKAYRTNRFGYGFIAKSEVRVSAPKATAKEWTETFGTEMNVQKVTSVTNARAASYQNKVNNVLAKQGCDKTFEAATMKGYHWVEGAEGVIKRADKDGSMQLCVTFQKGDRTRFVTRYLVDGNRWATTEEEAFIKAHLYTPKASAKQIANGVAEENVVMVRNYKFANLLAVGKSQEIVSLWNALNE
jgi:hypothetical protein